MKKLPFYNCVGCNKPIEEIGGKRIIRSRKGGVVLFNKKEGFYFDNIHTTFSVLINIDVIRNVFVWGRYFFVRDVSWESRIDEMKYHILEEGKIPWVCQNCIQHKTCENYDVVLDDDGIISYFYENKDVNNDK